MAVKQKQLVKKYVNV